MMMYRAHFEDTLAGKLKESDLKNIGNPFCKPDYTNQEYEQRSVDIHKHSDGEPSQKQRSGIAHEYACGVKIEYQIPDKRTRGRRGLDMIARLQEESALNVEIYSKDYDDEADVDSKLVRLAKEKRAKLITTNYNLNKAASIHKIAVLNINELANAIKVVLIPGETLSVRIVKEGKEQNQGVAYLDDGTMIVVENGRSKIGEQTEVSVTTVLQTAAGRMIFAKAE